MNLKIILFLVFLLPSMVFSIPMYKPMQDSPNFDKLHGFIESARDVFSHPDEMVVITKENFFKALQNGTFSGDHNILKEYPSIISFYRYGSFSLSDGSVFMWRMHRPDVITITDEEGKEGYIICPSGLPFKRTVEQKNENQ